jgi:hypothetical protein
MSREYTTRRLGIVNALVTKLKEINGTGEFLTNLKPENTKAEGIKTAS